MRHRGLIVAIVVLALLLVVARAAASLYTDQLWFHAMGADQVWRTRATVTLWLTLGSGLLAFLFAFANLVAVRHSVVSLILPRRVANLEFGEEVPGGRLVAAAALLAALIAAFLTIPGDRWAEALLARGGVPWGESDPYFQYDLGFFVYWLPFEETLHAWASLVVAAVSIAVVTLYALTPSLRWSRHGFRVTAYVRRHVTILGGIVLLLLAWSYRLDMYRVLRDGSGPGGAFTAIDHAVRVPGSLILAATTLGGALVVMWAGWTGQPKLAFFAVTVVLLLAFGVREIAPLGAEWMAIGGGARERPYTETRAGYTRRAYAVDQVRLGGDPPVFASLASAASGVPVWDESTLAAARGARAERVIWRAGANALEALVLDGGGADGAPSVVAVDPTASDPEAQGGGEARLLAPLLVADSAPGHRLVPDTTHIPAAIGVGTPLHRAAAALALRDVRLLFGDPAGRHPGLVALRDVGDIVERLAPFFAQGAAVAIADGDSLRWAIPLYSASVTYPLSARVALGDAEVGYLQRAGLAIVDAASGRVALYADSLQDPIAATWQRHFPGLIEPWMAIPAGVRGMLPPPREWVAAQVTAFAQVGARGGAGGGLHLPALDGADSARGTAGQPPMSTRGALVLALPLLDREERVAGVALARGGAVPATWWVPKVAVTARWGGVLDRLRGTTGNAGNAGGAKGSVRVIPLAQGIVFAQPVYGGPRGAQGVREVRLLEGDSLRTGRSLRDLSGVSTPVPEPDLRAAIARLYGMMRAALRRGDWGAFGAALDSIGLVLERSPR